MKRIIYYTCFTMLGGLLGFLLHSVVKIWYIGLLVNKYETFGLGLDFSTWFTIHKIFAIVLFVFGLAWGNAQGKKWWRILYIERKYGKFFKRPLKESF